MSTQITDEEAKEAGVNKEVFQMWNDVMQALWTAAIATYSVTKNDELFPSNGENEIFIGEKFRINANICNNKFIEANLFLGETQLAQITYEEISVTTICKCIFMIIKDINQF